MASSAMSVANWNEEGDMSSLLALTYCNLRSRQTRPHLPAFPLAAPTSCPSSWYCSSSLGGSCSLAGKPLTTMIRYGCQGYDMVCASRYSFWDSGQWRLAPRECCICRYVADGEIRRRDHIRPGLGRPSRSSCAFGLV